MKTVFTELLSENHNFILYAKYLLSYIVGKNIITDDKTNLRRQPNAMHMFIYVHAFYLLPRY